MKRILILIILLMAGSSSAQVVREWVQAYNGPANGHDRPFALTLDQSGNLYVVGQSWGTGTVDDLTTIKYSPGGTVMWLQRFNGPLDQYDRGYDVITDDSGNVYVTGSTDRGLLAEDDFILIKYNSAGAEQWAKTFNGTRGGPDQALAMAIDNLGNICITGVSVGISSEDDFLTNKYDPNGNLIWSRRHDGGFNDTDRATSIAIDDLNNIYVSGSSEPNSTQEDYLTIKYDSAGVLQWTQRYNNTSNGIDVPKEMKVDPSGNVYVTGQSTAPGSGFDCLTIKYNSSGVEQWVRRFNGPNSSTDLGSSLAIDAAGNIYVAGTSVGIGTNNDCIVIKYSSTGTEEWVARYNGTANGDDAGTKIALDNSGNIYVTGGSENNSTTADIITIRYSPSGVEEWVQRQNGIINDDDYGRDIAVDQNNNVYVTGTTIGNNATDFITIKYTQPVGIQQIGSSIPDNYSLSQNYPNPFNPSTVISFEIPDAVYTELAVYDNTGKLVQTLVSGNLNPGVYNYEFNASSLTSGVYYYKIQAGSFIETKKMAVVK